MLSSALSLAATALLAIQPAAAGFVVYIGSSNDGVPGEGTGGGGISSKTDIAIFFNEKPKGCDDPGQTMSVDGTQDLSNDNSNGFICDGCGQNEDLHEEYPYRFEVRDDQGDVFDGGLWFTLYKDEGKHTYGMYDPDDKRIGDCEITDDRDSLTCAHAIFGIDSSTLYWSCDTDHTIVDSN